MILTFSQTMFEPLPLSAEEADLLYETMLKDPPVHEVMELAAELLGGGLRRLYAEDGTLLGVWVRRPGQRRALRGMTMVWDAVRERYLVTSPRYLAQSLGKTIRRFEDEE